MKPFWYCTNCGESDANFQENCIHCGQPLAWIDTDTQIVLEKSHEVLTNLADQIKVWKDEAKKKERELNVGPTHPEPHKLLGELLGYAKVINFIQEGIRIKETNDDK